MLLRQSLDEVLDGQRTGRYDIEKLEKTEKTYLGTKVEILIRHEFGLLAGNQMDYLISGHEVDSKFSIRGSWSIPTEAVGHLCLLSSADDRKGIFSVGIIRITEEILNKGKNKDQKTTIRASERNRIRWLAQEEALPENILLKLPPATADAIMRSSSGQQRINELLRRVQGRVIDRNTAITVARQADGLKRCRDARIHLAKEGLVVLGHQGNSPIIAESLGLPTPRKGTFISARLVQVNDSTPERSAAKIGEKYYALAHEDDPVHIAPNINY